jgi:hypothetical protein
MGLPERGCSSLLALNEGRSGHLRHRSFEDREHALIHALGHVETHGVRGRLRGAEDVAGREHDTLVQSAASHVGGVQATWQTAPDEHSRVGLQPRPLALARRTRSVSKYLR